METINQFLFRTRALQFKRLRTSLIRQLYPTKTIMGIQGTTQQNSNQLLSDFLGSFSRYAGNQQTAFDSGAGRSGGSSSNTGNQLERQVERAIVQVLGRAPGRGAESFFNALREVFPTSADGRSIISNPSRSIVSLYSPEGSGISSNGNLVGQLSTQQATLHRQASVVAADALKILGGLKTFLPQADTERVENLRSLIASQLRALIDEFGRVDEPRDDRVEVYLNSLDLYLAEFGKRAFFDNMSLIATVDDESQTAGFELIKSYARTLRSIWSKFISDKGLLGYASLSERLEHATVLLPIIAQANTDFEDAMESVGFSESERRSDASRFDTLNTTQWFDQQFPSGGGIAITAAVRGNAVASNSNNTPNQPGRFLPDVTVSDLTDWLDRFASIEGPTLLSESGQYGLDFVTDQADKLFWVIAPIVTFLGETVPGQNNTSNRAPLYQLLSNERVRWALDNLLIQLDSLADLAVPETELAA